MTAEPRERCENASDFSFFTPVHILEASDISILTSVHILEPPKNAASLTHVMLGYDWNADGFRSNC